MYTFGLPPAPSRAISFPASLGNFLSGGGLGHIQNIGTGVSSFTPPETPSSTVRLGFVWKTSSRLLRSKRRVSPEVLQPLHRLLRLVGLVPWNPDCRATVSPALYTTLHRHFSIPVKRWLPSLVQPHPSSSFHMRLPPSAQTEIPSRSRIRPFPLRLRCLNAHCFLECFFHIPGPAHINLVTDPRPQTLYDRIRFLFF